MNVSGNVALITGGASGLGEATCRRLASLGAKVAVVDNNITPAEQVANEIGGAAIQCDVTDQASVAAAFSTAEENLGHSPRIVVSCAGIANAARIVGRESKLSIDLFEQVLRVNLFGSYNVMSYAAQGMMKQEPDDGGERGIVINTSSVAWQDGQLGQSAYAASKGAIASLCLPAAREFSQSAIRVMAIAPGLFRTPMMEGLPEEVTTKIAANVPFPARLGEAEEFALMVEQIIANPYLNGTTIRLDGAVRLPPK